MSVYSAHENLVGVSGYIFYPETKVLNANSVGKLDRSLSRSVMHALEAARGVTGFYSHQAAAINSIWSGKHVIVSTSTASGKSIIYQVYYLLVLLDSYLHVCIVGPDPMRS